MAQTLRTLTLVFLVAAVAFVTRWPLSSAVTSEAALAPETVATAVARLAPPTRGAADAVPTRIPILAPEALRLFYAATARSTGSTPPRNAALALAAGFHAGEPEAVIAARRLWLALDAVVLALLVIAGHATGRILAERGVLAHRGVSASASVSTGAVAVVDAPVPSDRLARRIVSWLPALLYALSPAAAAQVVGVSPTVPALVLALGSAALLLTRRPPGVGRVLMGGGFAGMAVAAHPAGVVLLPLALTLAARGERHRAVTSVAVVVIALVIGTLLGDPRIANDARILTDRAVTALTRVGPFGVDPAVVALGRAVGVLGAVIACVGVWRLAACRAGRPVLLAVGLPVAIAATVRVGGAVPLVLPLAFLLVAAGAAVAVSVTTSHRPALVAAVVGATLVGPALGASDTLARARRGDARDAARAWLAASLPDSARVVVTPYGPSLDDRRTRFSLPFDSVNPERFAGAYDLRWYDGFDTFVVSDALFDRYARDPERHTAPLRFLHELRASCRKLATFDDTEYLGSTVEVFARTHRAPLTGLETLLARPAPDPVSAEFHLSLGSAYFRIGHRSHAIALFEIAAQIAPTDPRVAVNLGGAYIEEGRLMEADQLLRDAVRAHPEAALVRYQYGRVKAKRRLWGEAIAEYKFAVRRDPTFLEAHFNLASAYLEVGNLEGATGGFRRVIELGGDSPLAERARAVLAQLEP